VERHKSAVRAVVEGRRSNLLAAADLWIQSKGILAYIDLCEARWKEATGEGLTLTQRDWLSWARKEAAAVDPLATGYPDPAIDGQVDSEKVPFGGPYPELRALVSPSTNVQLATPEKQVKTVSPEKAKAPEQFPFWLLHRRH
jgi:hypothetical protein